jgi:hypothetical protein
MEIPTMGEASPKIPGVIKQFHGRLIANQWTKLI